MSDEMREEYLTEQRAGEAAEAADISFLEEAAKEGPSSSILQDVSEKAKKLLALKWDMEEKEEAFNEAKKQYDEFRCVTLPTFMEMNGLSMIATEGGARVEVKSKYYCKPNKNPADMKVIAEFLEKHGHPELIQKGAVVEVNYLEKLEEAQIPYNEVEEVNTNSLKAWLKDQVGGNGGQIQLKMEDIPNCIHFIRMKECEITL